MFKKDIHSTEPQSWSPQYQVFILVLVITLRGKGTLLTLVVDTKKKLCQNFENSTSNAICE